MLCSISPLSDILFIFFTHFPSSSTSTESGFYHFSPPIRLIGGNQYYFEFEGIEGYDYFYVGLQLPDGTKVVPIYLALYG